MNSWIKEAQFYHIYPLGFCGAPHENDFLSSPLNRLETINGWIGRMQELGINVLLLGPVFESTTHGYDTADYRMVDRRLGTNSDLKNISESLHRSGIRLVVDGVFHHSGRDFGPFQDLVRNGSNSPFRDWFSGIDFSKRSPYGDPFTYNGWNSHQNLVKFNTGNPAVREYLFESIRYWRDEFGIDGLRLDAADSLDFDFMRALSGFCRKLDPDFWLMGEVIHGDYNRWTNPEMLDCVTNYEIYKGLWSSHNDANYFEIAYSLNRMFGPSGIYPELSLYNFADNHDVDRIASKLRDPAHLYPLHILLYTIPGIPSIYYGSEIGFPGHKILENDWPLRPSASVIDQQKYAPDLRKSLIRLSLIRKNSHALKYGNYRQILVNHLQFAFLRESADEKILVAVNSSASASVLDLTLPPGWGSRWRDKLNPDEIFTASGGRLKLPVYANWGRILTEF